MRFEWDEAKSRANRAKHGISFKEALTIFDGPVLTAVDRRWDYGEERLVSLGRLGGRFTTVVVVHVERADVTRIISARKATRYGDATIL